MNALLELIKKLFPTIDKTSLYQGLSILALVVTIFGSVYGVWTSINSNLDKHIHDRDVQVHAIEQRLDIVEQEAGISKHDVKSLKEQDAVIEKQIHSALEQRVGRLESAAMGKGK